MDLIIGAGSKASGISAAAASKDLIKDGTAATFMADVLEASLKIPVIVDFWAPWCGPCKKLGPALEKIVLEQRGAVRMVKINIDENQELAAQLRVQSVPTVYGFKDGRPFDAFAGALPESEIRAFVQRLTGGQQTQSVEEYIAQAKEIMAEGDVQTAAQIFQGVLAEDPDNAPATAGLLRCLMAVGDVDGAHKFLAALPDAVGRNPEIAAVRTALELQASAGAVGPASELRRKLALDPEDHQSRLDLAMAYYASGEHEAAVDELLDLFKRARAWNEDAARKQLVRVFEAIGPTHALTLSGRRRLSALLFS